MVVLQLKDLCDRWQYQILALSYVYEQNTHNDEICIHFFSLSMQSTNFTISKDFLVVCDFTVLVLGSVSELKHVVVKTVVKTFIFR